LNHGLQAPPPSSWTIPVTLKYSDGRRVRTWSVLLSEVEQTVRLEGAPAPAWVHPNAGERGYYRWQVPPEMLQALAAAGPPALDTRERVGLLNNLSALLDAGLLGGEDYLGTLARFADDPAPEVASALADALDKVHAAFVTPDLRDPLAVAARKLLGPSLARFGLEPARSEPEAVSLMRPNLLAALGVYGRDPEVLEWARRAARTYLAHPDSVDPSVAGTALNLAARDGDAALYEQYRTRFEQARVPSERARFLAALGHFRSDALLEKVLQYALTGPLRPQEILAIPSNMAENDELRDRLWGWFRSGYITIASRIPPFRLSGLPRFAYCCDTARIEEARVFFSHEHTDHPGTAEELAKVIDRIRDCAGLREREGRAVARYLVQLAQARPGPGSTSGP
jgi:hypothetical protein